MNWIARLVGRRPPLAPGQDDALATAQLLLVVMARAAQSGGRKLGDLHDAAAAQRWLAR